MGLTKIQTLDQLIACVEVVATACAIDAKDVGGTRRTYARQLISEMQSKIGYETPLDFDALISESRHLLATIEEQRTIEQKPLEDDCPKPYLEVQVNSIDFLTSCLAVTVLIPNDMWDGSGRAAFLADSLQQAVLTSIKECQEKLRDQLKAQLTSTDRSH